MLLSFAKMGKHSCVAHGAGITQNYTLGPAESSWKSAQGFVIELNVIQGRIGPAPVLLHDPSAELPPRFGLIIPHRERPASTYHLTNTTLLFAPPKPGC